MEQKEELSDFLKIAYKYGKVKDLEKMNNLDFCSMKPFA